MTQARRPREFSSTEHLASEAVAAYVDGELRMNAYLRAAHHISECMTCAAEVEAQQQARHALRGSGQVTMPHSLLGILAQIPHCSSGNVDATDTPGSAAPAAGRKLGLGSVVGHRFRRR